MIPGVLTRVLVRVNTTGIKFDQLFRKARRTEVDLIDFTSAGAISQRAKERMQRRDQEHREMLRQQVADGLLNEEEAGERGG
jgi:hypothetical protein